MEETVEDIAQQHSTTPEHLAITLLGDNSVR